MTSRIYIDCLDDNGNRVSRTAKGWHEFHKARGTEKGNKAGAISARYRIRREKGYTMRVVAGLDDVEIVQPIRSKQRVYVPDNSIIGVFLRKRLVL